MSHSRKRNRKLFLAAAAAVVIAGGAVYAWKNRTKPQPQVASTPTAETTPPPATQSAPVQAQLLAEPESHVLITETPTTKVEIAAAPTPTPPPGPPVEQPEKKEEKPAVVTGGVVAEAQKLKESGDLLGARKLLNDALPSLPEDQAASARSMLSEINQAVVYSSRRFVKDPFGGTYAVESGDNLTRIARDYSVTPALLLRINNMSDARKLRADSTIKVIQGPFHAVVYKKAFRLELYLGGLPGEKNATFITSFPVGLGENDSTPTGKWAVKRGSKIDNPTYYSPRGEGVFDKDDPKNPLGEFWIGLEGVEGNAVGQESYGIHGTIEPDSIGKQQSLGCIRLRHEDIKQVFEALIEEKSTVLIKD